MASQFYCGVFDKQADADASATYFGGHGFVVTGPTEYDLAGVDAFLAGVQYQKTTGQGWIVIAIHPDKTVSHPFTLQPAAPA